ncbi:MAG: CDP-glucose 4,6-dehydratase, partial [Pseudomonadota bacterium]
METLGKYAAKYSKYDLCLIFSEFDMEFWQGKKVFITGHTGFKGSWLSLWLQSLGAEVIGISLAPPTQPNFFEIVQLSQGMISILGDIRDFQLVQATLRKYKPEIVIHMAAQSLVRYSYLAPIETYATNVMGTVNLLEAARLSDSVKVLINVTSDKCYENKELLRGYREEDRLGGYDPYSNSKACSELVTQAYSRSYLKNLGINIATARAGNVIGGGDWAKDRLVPDIVNACIKQQDILLRYPDALRPWQHVLEPLNAYLILAKQLYESSPGYTDAWNFGPDENQALKTVSWLAERIIQNWGCTIKWIKSTQAHKHEASLLKLNSSKANLNLAWKPCWDIETAISHTIGWYKDYIRGEGMQKKSLAQISEFLEKYNLSASLA